MMSESTSRIDGAPRQDRCDFCGHVHACYVGGSPIVDGAGGLVGWTRHVCLGCVLRAATTGGFDSCASCAPAVRLTVAGASHA